MDAKEMQARAWASRKAKLSPEALRQQLSDAGKKGGRAGKGTKKNRAHLLKSGIDIN